MKDAHIYGADKVHLHLSSKKCHKKDLGRLSGSQNDNAKQQPPSSDFGKTCPKSPDSYYKAKYRPSSLSLKGRHRPSNSLFFVSWLVTDIKSQFSWN